MVNIYFFYAFLVALFATLILVPPVSKLSVPIGGLDRRDARKVHEHDVPRLGGVAMFCSFSLAFGSFVRLTPQNLGFAAGAAIIFLTGLADDLFHLSAKKKLLGAGMAALVAVTQGGARLESLGNLFGRGDIALGALALPFSVLAIVGVINAVNLLDGLDGLAAGSTLIACAVFGILGYQTGNQPLTFMAVALLGSLVGFLKYNSYPARVFMGDSGSLFLGYCMGYFSISLINGSAETVSKVTPLIILAIPVLDTLFVMYRRFRSGQGLFTPDRSHVHHRLLGMGVGHQGAVVVVYVASYLLSAVAVLTSKLPDYQLAAILVLGCAVLCVAARAAVGLVVRRAGAVSGMLKAGRTCRRLVAISRHLRTVIKYLAIFVLLLTAAIPHQAGYQFPVVAGLLLLLSLTLLLLTGTCANRFLLFSLYFTGAFLVFAIDNLARSEIIFGVPVLGLSHLVFLVLFCVEGLELFLRRRPGLLVNSTLESLLLLMVLSVPFMPTSYLTRYHLASVVGKSVILFLAYKLVLMRKPKRNRRLIVATQLALAVCMAKIMALVLLAGMFLCCCRMLLRRITGWAEEKPVNLWYTPPRLGQLEAAQLPACRNWPIQEGDHFGAHAPRQARSAARALFWFRLRNGEFDQPVGGHQLSRSSPAQRADWSERPRAQLL
jgi:UDP-GlcNAc:undecaprenyl-phosphate GlcNAc-1-phosphate transferase